MIGNLPLRAAAKVLRMASAKMEDTACILNSHPLLTRSEKAILARNGRFQDRYKGSRAFVVGNGPSLNKLRLEHLAKELVFVVNGFACHPILESWQPVALCLADSLYVE